MSKSNYEANIVENILDSSTSTYQSVDESVITRVAITLSDDYEDEEFEEDEEDNYFEEDEFDEEIDDENLEGNDEDYFDEDEDE